MKTGTSIFYALFIQIQLDLNDVVLSQHESNESIIMISIIIRIGPFEKRD